ncbi:hypothetical protein QYM36_004174, partial [Artemia franciscana]
IDGRWDFCNVMNSVTLCPRHIQEFHVPSAVVKEATDAMPPRLKIWSNIIQLPRSIVRMTQSLVTEKMGSSKCAVESDNQNYHQFSAITDLSRLIIMELRYLNMASLSHCCIDDLRYIFARFKRAIDAYYILLK